MSAAEEMLARQIHEAGLPEPEREHIFSKSHNRRYRFDFAWPDLRLAVEVQGGIWCKGKSKHSSGVGIRRDMLKHNLATLLGWRVILIESDWCKDDRAVNLIQAAFEGSVEKALWVRLFPTKLEQKKLLLKGE